MTDSEKVFVWIHTPLMLFAFSPRASGRLCTLKWLSDAVFSVKLIRPWMDSSPDCSRSLSKQAHSLSLLLFNVSCTWKDDKMTAFAFCLEARIRKLSHFRRSRNKKCARYPVLFCSTFPSFSKTRRKKKRKKTQFCSAVALPSNLDAPFCKGVTHSPDTVWSA